jgi:TRAP-type C4-dicarboxylate transport system permease small subunit
MTSIGTVASWLRRRAENIVAILLASMFLTFLIQIAFRYLLNLPLGWTVEYVAIVWLWGILFGYAFVIRDEEVIRFDLVYAAVPDGVRRWMDIVTGLTVAGIFLWSLPKAYDYVTFMRVERTAYMRIRFDLVFAIYIPFAVSVIVRALVGAGRAWRSGARPIDPSARIGDHA